MIIVKFIFIEHTINTFTTISLLISVCFVNYSPGVCMYTHVYFLHYSCMKGFEIHVANKNKM